MIESRWSLPTSVCVGLDSDYDHIQTFFHRPTIKQTIVEFNRSIIEATHDLVCAYKPNIAFYEAHGVEGIAALIETIRFINECAPKVPVILDAKRGDRGNTNNCYVKAAFEIYGADAITINPFFGAEAVEPFLKCKDKGIFILCRTSNPGAGEFQHLMVGNLALYQIIASHVAHQWNTNGNCGLVVGATSPQDLCNVRQIVGNMPLLIPGIGSQGGDLQRTVAAGIDSRGSGIIISVSRSIIFASKNADFPEASRKETEVIRDAIEAEILRIYS